MSKKEIEKKLEDVERLADQVLLKKRLEWLNKVCREAKELGLGSLGELVAFMLDHSSDILLKGGSEVKCKDDM